MVKLELVAFGIVGSTGVTLAVIPPSFGDVETWDCSIFYGLEFAFLFPFGPRDRRPLIHPTGITLIHGSHVQFRFPMNEAHPRRF